MFFRGNHRHPDFKDAPVIHLGHGDIQIFVGEVITFHGDSAQLFQHPAADGGRVDVHCPQGEAVKEVIQAGRAGDEVAAVLLGLR